MPLQEDPLTPDLFHGQEPQQVFMADQFLKKDNPHSGCLPYLLTCFELDGELHLPESLCRKPQTKNISYQNTNKEIGKISTKITNLLPQLSLVPKFIKHIVFLCQEI